MIGFQEFRLSNGLQVYVHEDPTTPMAVVNLTYNVGSRDESEHYTGFAHLFEHLMFGGSRNIPSYDEPVQNVGGENNAFTSPDITNYYITLPAPNIETALWLESDRMLGLSFDPGVLEVQQKVVIEEYKQRYLNQPYGDIWLKTLPLSYREHPYRWATIGKDIAHIENATMEQVIAFYEQFYCPDNAVLVVGGGVRFNEVRKLVEKWFGEIPPGPGYVRNLPVEARQEAPRLETASAAVPLDALVKTWHMPGRYDAGFFDGDLLSDLLGRGKSSRLYHQLLKKEGLFNSIQSSITSSLDPGLLIVRGFLNPGVSLEEADAAIEAVMAAVVTSGVTEAELVKVKNQSESTLVFSEVDLLNRAMNLGYAANAGNAEWVNADAALMRAVTTDSIHEAAREILRPENCSTLYYRKEAAGA